MNMSYCKFENTARDMQDCGYSIEEAMSANSSQNDFKNSLSGEDERMGFDKFKELISLLAEAFAAWE